MKRCISCSRVFVSTRPALAGRLGVEPLGLHGEMHLVLEARILALGEQAGIVGDDVAQRLDPGRSALAKSLST